MPDEFRYEATFIDYAVCFIITISSMRINLSFKI